MSDVPELLVDGRIYAGWTEMRVTRAMDRAAADFDLRVSERWPGRLDPWRLQPFTPVVLRFGRDVVLTGYVDYAAPEADEKTHRVRIVGRSKTADLVDCTPEIAGTEFRGATLPAIARALARPFGVEVVEEVPPGAPFSVEAKDRTDTAWETIERLARMRGVLAHDDEQGRLVLTRAGSRRASEELVMGRNIVAASAKLDGSKRYSRYVVLSQRQTGAAVARDGDGDDDDSEPDERPNAGVQVSVSGVAEDPDVPRYRPRILRSEGSGDAAFARARAVWAAASARGKAVQAEITVQGWRQQDGRLWRVNELIKVRADWMRLDHELLIVGTEFTLDDAGRRTMLTLTPPEAMTPEPAEENRRGGAGGGSWADVRPIR